MKYKMIVTDFDGTLLRSDNTVSKAVRAAIQRYRAAGGIFTVSTGRSFLSIQKRLPEAGLLDSFPVMALQGGYVADSVTGEKLFSVPLGFADMMRFAAAAKRADIYYHVYTEDGIYVDKHTEASKIYERVTGTTVTEVGDVGTFLRGREDIIKVLSVCDAAVTRGLCVDMQRAMPDLQIFTSSPLFIECVSKAAGKGNGVRRVAEVLGVDIADVAAVGDEMNDYSMIEAAGLGVAVGNAVEPLKAAADKVVASNDEDGIAELIEFCLHS